MMKSMLFVLFAQLLSTNSYAQQHEVVSEGEAQYSEDGRFVCRQNERHETMRNAWKLAKADAEIQCGLSVQLREKYEEFIKCSDFGTSIYASVKARFACVPNYDSCEIQSPYCENDCCD